MILIPGTGTAEKFDSGQRMSQVKKAYLDSIYDDISFIIDGIELFCKRDYPNLWDNIESEKKISPEILKKYIKETANFRNILDTHLSEFTTIIASDKGKPGNKEKEIFQMLSYAYLSTGNFITARALASNEDVLNKETEIQVSKLNGEKEAFNLTESLKKRLELLAESLGVIKLDMKYFTPEDLDTVNAYIEVNSSKTPDAVNIMYANAYRGVIPYKEKENKYQISINMLFSFLKNLKYFELNSPVNNEKEEKEFKGQKLSFLIMKGSYSLKSQSSGIKISQKSNNQFIIEKKFLYKGFEDTGFNLAKNEKETSVILKKTNKEYKKNNYLEYGRYKIIKDDEVSGFALFKPCYKDKCGALENKDPATTPVKIYGHELVVYQDLLDRIKVNLKQNQKDFSSAGNYNINEIDNNHTDKNKLKTLGKSQGKISTGKTENINKEKKSESDQKIHLFGGCAKRKNDL